MSASRDRSRVKLLESVPVILETHFSSISKQSKEYEEFVGKNKLLLHTGFEVILKELVESLFLDSSDYRQYLMTNEQSGYHQGIITADLLGQNVHFVMELSKNLHLSMQQTMFRIIEETEENRAFRLALFERVVECDWTRFVGFVSGYIAHKDEKIDYLHAQKISVMGQMAAGMAHEIRNPLSTVKGFAQLIKNKLQANDREINVNELIQYLELSIDEIDSINGLVSDFLLLARKNENSANIESRVDLKAIIDKVSALTRQMMIESNITLRTEVPQADLYVYGVASQLEQVFLNIVKNSVDALKSGGTLTIAAAADPSEQQVIIQFIDNGTGVPKDIMDKIFDPFFTTKVTGTGLGLAICKQIIENHNGSIIVESEVDKGTTARIQIKRQS
ncbi:two-component system sensor histidine kinase NtrB [Cohnella kolymensis]|uniref:two-component system sensor histidine kinase NtrB n=1 Tax=Cohnella kolymensis TaxID=1590652 RepID=UPI00069751C8|nr:ATP-binding protein [Cohnella kolymensis]